MSDAPLNPFLFAKLRKIDPHVTISKPGEATTFFPADAYGRKTLKWSGEQYQLRCPFCRDHRPRLYVNHVFGVVDPETGDDHKNLATCFNDDGGCLSDFENRKKLHDSVYGFRNVHQRNNIEIRPGRIVDTSLRPVQAPGLIQPVSQLPPGHRALEYMLSRRYTPEMLDRYQIGLCTEASSENRMAQGRIVFPVFMHNQLVGWQARHVGDAETHKYVNAKGMKKSYLLYNYDHAKKFPYTVVVEGCTDSNFVGDPSVALLGKSLSLQQRNLLLENWSTVIFMLDADAREQSRSIVQELIDRGRVRVVNVELPDGVDPADCDPQALWGFIREECSRRGVVLA